MEAETGTKLTYDFKEHLTMEGFEQAIAANTLPNYVREVAVEKGDSFFIPPGTLHAIGEGMVILEIQKRSDVTYRISDYGRRDKDGKLRELHIDRALEVTNREVSKEEPEIPYVLEAYEKAQKALLADCGYFHVDLFHLQGGCGLKLEDVGFHTICVVEGELDMIHQDHKLHLLQGESAYIDDTAAHYRLEGEGKAVVVSC